MNGPVYFITMYYNKVDSDTGVRIIIMTQANSQVNTRVLELLPKFKIKKMNRWCFVEFYENKYYNYIIIKD